jgi:predicted nucleic acid-binding protein
MPELADTSVWARRHLPQVQPWFAAQVLLDQLGITDIVKLEILHSARGAADFDQLRQELDGLPQAPVGPVEWARALEVMRLLAHLRPPQQHRAVRPADLLIAAAAEARGWTLVHYDSDFDLVARVTGQPMRWLARRGSL